MEAEEYLVNCKLAISGKLILLTINNIVSYKVAYIWMDEVLWSL